MRTTIDIDTHLLKGLRTEATRRRVPFKEVVAGALRRGLETAAKPAASPIPLPTYDMGAPLIDIDQARHLAAAFEDGEILHKLALRETRPESP
jgi:hypothetical protein